VGHIGGNAYVVKTYEHCAYVGVGAELVVLDVTNPGSPILAGSLLLLDLIWVNASNYPYAYIADYQAGLVIVDIANPMSMYIVSATPGATWSFCVAVYGNYIYMGSSSQDILIFDVYNPEQPMDLGYLPFSGQDIEIYEAYAYIANGGDGLYPKPG